MNVLYRLSLRTATEQRMLLEAVGLIALIRVCLALLAFPTVLRVVRWLARTPPYNPATQPDAANIAWAVAAAGRRLLRRNPCLTEALAGLVMFRRVGYSARLRIGVLRDDDSPLGAHAWLECEGQVVIGGTKSALRYVSLPTLELER